MSVPVKTSDFDFDMPRLFAIAKAVDEDLLAGYPNRTFKPNANVTRVEALTSMIKNLSDKTGTTISEIISDKTIFNDSNKIVCLNECMNSRKFEMCVRVASRMLAGGLPDSCHGATKFHHADIIPEWAIARGYIDDVDGLLFYL